MSVCSMVPRRMIWKAIAESMAGVLIQHGMAARVERMDRSSGNAVNGWAVVVYEKAEGENGKWFLLKFVGFILIDEDCEFGSGGDECCQLSDSFQWLEGILAPGNEKQEEGVRR